MVALLSPPGATHDEWYHASSIWCGQGIRAPYCVEKGISEEGLVYAITNLDGQNCQRDPRQELYCPTARSGQGSALTNNGLYPRVFYFVLSWFVVPSMEISFVLIRIVSALLVTAVFGMTYWLLSARYRLVLVLVGLTTFTSTGFFLFASINPSSWTMFGVGIGWIPLHAALASRDLSVGSRAKLVGISSVAFLMAAGSRWDAVPFLALAIALVCTHSAWTRAPGSRTWLVGAILVVPVALILLLERFSPFSPLHHLRILFTYSDSQPDNLAFVSYHLLHGVPNALGALGSVPTMSGVILPSIVYPIALAVLALLLVQTFNHRDLMQLLGILAIAIAISAIIAAQVAVNDARDYGAIEPRYVAPLLVFGVGWWFLQGGNSLQDQVGRYLKPIGITSCLLFALTMFTVTERFVDKQTYGIRYLPEGPDQWWWPWLPFGPNIPVILAPLFLWFFARGILRNHAPQGS